MIIAERKPFTEVLETIRDYDKVFIAACGTCVTVCYAGGEREAEMLGVELRIARKLAGKPLHTVEKVVERQCEWEFLEDFRDEVAQADAIVSLACGVGINTMAERFDKPVLPGVNTCFIGLPQTQGQWQEKCVLCGDCLVHLTGGLCPVARCSKGLLNGPCAGSKGGVCEVNPEVSCGWQLIFDRLSKLGRVAELDHIVPARDWSTDRFGGTRTLAREDMVL